MKTANPEGAGGDHSRFLMPRGWAAADCHLGNDVHAEFHRLMSPPANGGRVIIRKSDGHYSHCRNDGCAMLSWQCEVRGVGLHQYTLPLPGRMEGKEAWRQTVHLGSGAKKKRGGPAG